MGWLGRHPHDANEQLIEFAATGRLVDLDPRLRTSAADRASTILVLVLTSASIGVAVTLLVAAIQTASVPTAIIGLSLFAISLTLLLPTIRLVRLHSPDRGVSVTPGAVLPPELLQAGNWIYRTGAWIRVEQVGRDGNGALSALLSSGEVIDLNAPLTVAGEGFRPSDDPVASLRR